MNKTITRLSRQIHLFFWRITGQTDNYVKLQIASSHKTRENKTVQANIKIALEKLYSLNTDKSIKILDAGCGDGWTMDQLRNNGYNNLWGIDVNDEKLAVARKYGHKNVAQSLLPDLKFADNFFDLIFCRHVYEHLLYPQETLKTFFRILKKSGILFLIAPKSEITAEANEAHTVKISTSNDITVLMEAVGFTVILQEEHFLEELEFWIIAQKD